MRNPSKWRALAAAGIGLAAGWLCRPAATRPNERNVAEPVAKKVRRSPTLDFIRETSATPAGRCEETLREMCADGVSQDAVKMELMFRRWMELENPADLLARLDADDKAFPKSRWADAFFEAWAARDYTAAMAGTAKDHHMGEVRARVAMRREDPAFLKEDCHLGIFDNSALSLAISKLGQDNPELAKGIANANGRPPESNTAAITAVASGWAKEDPRAAMDWVESLALSPEKRMKALNEIFSQWAKSDRAGAAEAIRSSAGDLRPDQSIRALGDPTSAEGQLLVANHLDPFLGLEALHRILADAPVDWEKRQFGMAPIDHDGWFTADAAKSAEKAALLPAGKARDFLLSYIAGQWAWQDPEAAADFAKRRNIPPPAVDEIPPAETLTAMLAAPQETLASIFNPEQPGDDPAARKSQIKLAAKWAETDPRSAAEWLISRPESATNDFGGNAGAALIFQNALGYHWAKMDAVGASDWVAALPDGPRKRAAWGAMSGDVGEYSPDLAFSLSAEIVHDGSRARYLESELKIVAAKIGGPAARELLKTTALGDVERAALLESLDHPQP